MYKFFYFLKNGIKNLKSSALITVISTLTISVALILIGLFIVITVNINRALSNFSNNFSITVYLKSGISPEKIETLIKTFKSMPQIDNVSFQSSSEIKKEIIDIFGQSIVKGIPDEALPLQPAINLTLKVKKLDKKNLNDALRFIKRIKEVDSVEGVVHGISSYRLLLLLGESFKYVVLIVTIIVIIASLFFIFSNIRLSIFARKDEIEVMKLVGATKWFIRIPFLIEGVIQGMIGGIIGFIILAIINFHINSYITTEYYVAFEINLIPSGIVSLFFFGGILLGFLGSFFSLFKYLKI